MNRSLKLSILMALALGSTQAAAVELGQAHIKSTLGQPLLVEIPVTQASPADLQSLSATLAPSDAFVKAGISGGRPSLPLQFSVVDVNGQKVIRITTTTAVNDPYIDLLVQVTSSSGSNVSEVAVLLDPPTKTKAAASSAPTRRHATAPASGSEESTASAPPRQAAAAPEHHENAVKSGQITVEKGQTLSHVAVETTPAGVDKNQMMLALKAANPDAFYRDNINALKAGAVLRVPSHDDVAAITAADAAATVRQQNSDWRNGSVPAATAVAAGGTRANTSVAPTATSNADTLALVPPGSEGQSAGGANGKGANANVRQALQRSQETLSSLQQQSDELKSRLKDLEDINSKNQRLLSLKDNEIADLQKKLTDARKASGLPPAPAVAAATSAVSAPATKTESPLVATPPSPVTSHTPAVASASTAAKSPLAAPANAATAAAVTAPPIAPVAKPIVRPAHHVPVTAAAPAEQPWYMQSWAWILGFVVVALALFGLFARRGKSTGKVAKTAPVGTKGGSLADRFGTADLDSLDHSGPDPDQDQLLDQLAEQPDDIELHLELVSLYYTRRDVEHFEAAAEAMHAHISDPDQPEWQDVVHMGQDLAPGHPLFADSAIAPTARDDSSSLHRFDLDNYGSNADTAPVKDSAKDPAPAQAKVSEYHFDFDLTPHNADAAANTQRAAVVKEAEEPVSTWHFDETADSAETAHTEHNEDFGDLHDDPIDTKLDLARAYLDMGDPDGARAMLDEVMQEGTQMQQEVAKTLMAKIR